MLDAHLYLMVSLAWAVLEISGRIAYSAYAAIQLALSPQKQLVCLCSEKLVHLI